MPTAQRSLKWNADCRLFKNSVFLISQWLLRRSETFSISTTSTQPFQRARLKCWNPFMLTTTRNTRDTPKSCTETFKEKKSVLQYFGRQGNHKLSFKPHFIRLLHWLWPRCKNGGNLQNMTKKLRKPTSPGSSLIIRLWFFNCHFFRHNSSTSIWNCDNLLRRHFSNFSNASKWKIWIFAL